MSPRVSLWAWAAGNDRAAGAYGGDSPSGRPTGERDREFRAGRNGRIEAELQQVVHGVVISRRSIGVDAWLQALAQDIARAAAREHGGARGTGAAAPRLTRE
jgi:hypothetical protein